MHVCKEGSMSMPAISIDASLKVLWPETRLGCLFYDAAPGEASEELHRLLVDRVLPPLRATLETTPLAEMPRLGASRRAYKAFGKDPGRFRISSEALYRRIRRGKDLYRINAVVDTNNLVSLETGFSLGSYDAAHLDASVVFRRGKAGESYPGIGKGNVDLENMPLFADSRGPFGSPTSDSTRAVISPETIRVLFVIFAFSERTALEEGMTLAAERFRQYAGAIHLQTRIVE